ncbi:hypothetical protein ACQCVB_19560 [Fictibacillus phosphorivorans]|uniref:hypothetical protein n=1 Tax=Fictibacillus phosphorivorans TaxID=1221500 RepID=UPI003CEC59E5
MKITNILFVSEFDQIKDPENDSIEIIIELEDGYSYTMVVATPKNVYTVIEGEGRFLSSGPPMLFVKKLTKESVIKVVQDFATGDAYWLKSYYLATVHDIETLDQLIDKFKDQVKEYSEI